MALGFSCFLLCMHLPVKAGSVGEEKAVPHQPMNFAQEDGASGM